MHISDIAALLASTAVATAAAAITCMLSRYLDGGAAEVSCQAQHIGKDSSCRDLRSGARAADDQRLLVVPFGGEEDDVVAAAQGGKCVRLGVAAELHLRDEESEMKTTMFRAWPEGTNSELGKRSIVSSVIMMMMC